MSNLRIESIHNPMEGVWIVHTSDGNKVDLDTYRLAATITSTVTRDNPVVVDFASILSGVWGLAYEGNGIRDDLVSIKDECGMPNSQMEFAYTQDQLESMEALRE